MASPKPRGEAAGGRKRRRDGPQLADRAVRLSGGAGRVLELAGRAGGLARDVRALRPVAPHDRPPDRRARTRSSSSPTSASTRSRTSRRTRRSSSSPATTTGTSSATRSSSTWRRTGSGSSGARPRTTGCSTTPRPGGYDVQVSSGTSEPPSTRRAGASSTASRSRGRPRWRCWRRRTAGRCPRSSSSTWASSRSAGGKVRALHHGMSGVPGLELFGPVGGAGGRPGRDRRGRRGLRAASGRRRARTRRTRSSRAGSRARSPRSSPATR